MAMLVNDQIQFNSAHLKDLSDQSGPISPQSSQTLKNEENASKKILQGSAQLYKLYRAYLFEIFMLVVIIIIFICAVGLSQRYYKSLQEQKYIFNEIKKMGEQKAQLSVGIAKIGDLMKAIREQRSNSVLNFEKNVRAKKEQLFKEMSKKIQILERQLNKLVLSQKINIEDIEIEDMQDGKQRT